MLFREGFRMNRHESVSVVIPTYNRARLLLHCIDGILAQTYPVHEIIVVDDGSTDETADVLQRYIYETPARGTRIIYIPQPNQGQTVAFNNGIAQATGDWIAFQGSDDLWLPQKLEWQFLAIKKYKEQCGVCFSDAWFMNNPHMKMTVFELAHKQFREPLGIIHDPIRLMANQHPVWMQTVVARADLVSQVGGLDPKLRYSEDHDFLFQMALETKFCYVSMPMVLIDRSPAETRHVGEAENWHKEEFCLQMDQYRLEKQHRLSERLPPDVRKTIRRNLRSIHSAWANWYLTNGDYQRSRESLSTAAKYELTPGIAFKWALSHISPKLMKKVLSIRDRNSALRYDRVSWKDEIKL
jgi:hypothetical protein